MTLRGTAVVCPGQGSQHPGMLDNIPSGSHVARLLDAAEAMSDLELRALDRLAEVEELSATRVAQPLLYLADWAWGRALMDAGLEPIAVAGHSLGEFAALALADAFSVEAGLQLVIERSSLMAAAANSRPGAMAAVLGLSAPAVSDVLADLSDVWLANDNCPGQLVISGTTEGIDAAKVALHDAGAKRVVPLAVSGGFHSPLMQDASDEFAQILSEADIADAAIPVVQNTAPQAPATDAEVIRENLSRQMISPVRWNETMATLRSLGADVLVEAGPGNVLTGLARRAEGMESYSAETEGLRAVMEVVRV